MTKMATNQASKNFLQLSRPLINLSAVYACGSPLLKRTLLLEPLVLKYLITLVCRLIVQI